MDSAHVIRWILVTMAAVATFVHLRTHRLRLWGWLLVYALILLLLGVGWALSLEYVPLIALLAWMALVVWPALFQKRAMRFAMARRYDEAQRAAFWAALAHPMDGGIDLARYLRALGAGEGDEPVAAARLFENLRRSPRFGPIAELERLCLMGDFDAALSAYERFSPAARVEAQGVHLRALMEAGQLERTLSTYAKMPSAYRELPSMRLLFAIAAGREDWTQAVLSSSLRELPQDQKRYLLALTAQAAGHADEAAVVMQELAQGRGATARKAARRITRPLPSLEVETMSDEAKAALRAFDERMGHERQLAPAVEAGKKPYGTIGLAVLLLVVFAISASGGATDPDNLVSLGALVLPPSLVGGEVLSRVVMAGLLHFGFLHFAMNVLGLWAVGSAVERLWGALPTLVVFWVGSIGAFGLAVLTSSATVEEPRVLLGASAGVMALVGALGTFSAVGFFYGKNQLLKARMLRIGLVLLAQTAFDLSTPMVSSFLHVAGFGFGALAAVPWSLRFFRPR